MARCKGRQHRGTDRQRPGAERKGVKPSFKSWNNTQDNLLGTAKFAEVHAIRPCQVSEDLFLIAARTDWASGHGGR